MGKAQADVIVARLATSNRNLVTRSNLREAGLTDRQIDSRIKIEQLTVVHRGVFLLGGGDPDFEQRCLAAALASGGWVSHRAAAALFDLRRMEREHVDVTVTGRRRALSLAGVSAHWTGSLKESECTSVLGIPATAPARTLLDIAGLVSPAVLEGALDDALVRRLTHLGEVQHMLQGLGGRGHPGIDRFRHLVFERVGGQRPTESPLEDELFALIRRFGLPEPVRQFPLQLPSGRQIRMDGAYPECFVDVEADGRRYHGSHSARRADNERDRECSEAGWTVLRFTAEDIRLHPRTVADVIAAALARSVRELPTPEVGKARTKGDGRAA
jgi:very-short-patch-repair endonuclease